MQKIRLSNNEKVSFISSLATMLSAGIPILEAVDSLIEDSKGNQKKVLDELRKGLIAGKHMSVSLAEFPLIFDRVTISIIKASEEAGNLESTLKDLKENIKKEIEFSDKVKAALFYPLTVMVIFVGVLLVILTIVVPRIATVFTRLKVELPLSTRVMIFISDLLIKNTLLLIGGLVLFIFLLVLLYKKNRQFFINLISSLPLVSNLVREIDITKLSRSLFFLLSSGIPITMALDLAKDVVVKKDIEKVIIRSKELILTGEKLSIGLKQSKGIMPSIMIKIIEAGEKTGSLDKAMQDVSDHFDYQVSKSLKTITALLEPIMLVFVGIMVGGMMLAIIAPIYGLIGKVGGR